MPKHGEAEEELRASITNLLAELHLATEQAQVRFELSISI